MSYRGEITAINAVTNANSSTARNLKVWAGTVRSDSQGSWSVNLRNAGFKNVYSVTATAQFNATDASAVPIAGVRTHSITGVTGWVVQSNNFTMVLLSASNGLKFCTTPVTVHVQVIGD